MSSETAGLAPRLNPTVAWTAYTDAPLVGFGLAREAGLLLAWDDSNHLYLIGPDGQRITDSRAPGKIIDATIADTGTLIAVVLGGPRLLLLDGECQPLYDRPALSESAAITVDPHGRFLCVSTRTGKNQFYTRHGKLAGSFETIQPLSFARFLATRPVLVAASSLGTLFAFKIEGEDGRQSLQVEELWRSQMMSNVGRLEITGDGGMILTSCYTHGIQRFDMRGRNEGAYHLGGTTAHAVPDFTGRLIAVATTEGELFLLNRTGNIRWKTGLARGPIALVCDPLGRSVTYGLPSGEIVQLQVEPSGRKPVENAASTAARKVGTSRTSAGPIRQPSWTIPVADSDDQAETAALAVLDDPCRIAVITNTNRMSVFTPTGGHLGQAPPIVGVGRILRCAQGWLAAATDRQIVLYDARRNQAERLDLNLVELTHLVIRPDDYGMALAQERDRIGRVTMSGRWVWKQELRVGVEDLAVGSKALTAFTTDDGRLTILDPAGERLGSYDSSPPEPLLLVAAPPDTPEEIGWITLARRAQVLRGHHANGQVAWESPVPWEAWRLQAVGSQVVAEAPDGRSLAFDGLGHARQLGKNPLPPGLFFPDDANDQVLRIYRHGEHLICCEPSGRVRWRSIPPEGIGPMAAGASGVAALIGRSLAWFPASVPDGDQRV